MGKSTFTRPAPPSKEQQPLIDRFNDFVLLVMEGRTWTPAQRTAYQNLHRKIEAVSQ